MTQKQTTLHKSWHLYFVNYFCIQSQFQANLMVLDQGPAACSTTVKRDELFLGPKALLSTGTFLQPKPPTRRYLTVQAIISVVQPLLTEAQYIQQFVLYKKQPCLMVYLKSMHTKYELAEIKSKQKKNSHNKKE